MKRDGYSGIVYIESEFPINNQLPPIEGHWELGDEFEEGPGWSTAAEAIDWGRHRAPFVLLRIDLVVYGWRYIRLDYLWVRLRAPAETRYVFYSAGEAHRDDREWRRWPGASAKRDSDVADGYGGVVHLTQVGAEWAMGVPIGYTARWEATRDGAFGVAEMVGPAWEGDLPAAVAWGRGRAPYVLICEDARSAGYESAGERDLPGIEIPRWLGDDDQIGTWGEIPSGPFEVTWSFGEPIHPTTFPIPDGLEPAGGLPPMPDEGV